MQKVLARHESGKLPNKAFSTMVWDMLPGEDAKKGEWLKIGLTGDPETEAKVKALTDLPNVPKTPVKPPELTAEEKARAEKQAAAEAEQKRAAALAAGKQPEGEGTEATPAETTTTAPATPPTGENKPPAPPAEENKEQTGPSDEYRELVTSAKEAEEAGKLEDARDLFIQAGKVSENNWIKGQINRLNETIGE